MFMSQLVEFMKFLALGQDSDGDVSRKARRHNLILQKLTILFLLAGGGVSPIFRHEPYIPYLSFLCVGILAALAGINLLKR